MGWKIRGVDRLTVHRLGEVKKQLRQVALGLETVRARPVIPFLQAIEFYLQTQILNIQIVGALLLLGDALLLLVTLQQQPAHHRLQCFLIFR
jgi:hypothetical protein